MNDMKSMYYVKREDLGEYELKNIFLDKSFFQSRTNLRIGVSPITNEDVLKISYYEKEQSVYFSIDGLKNESDIRKKVGDIITKAKETDVDILLFPEMLGMEVLMEDYRKLFEEDWNGRYPKMIVFPSIWCNHTNTSVILGMDGNEIGRQQKQNKFFYEVEKQETQENGKIRKVAVKANEGLEPDKKILLFHIEGLGRVAVMICMDFLERDYRNMILDVLKGTFLLVPSFSTGYFDFTNAMQACCEYDCSVVWGNCCSAMNIGKMKRKNFEDIGYIQFSGKLTDSIGKISIEEGNRCSKKNCKKDCLFINDIPLNTQDKTNVEILF